MPRDRRWFVDRQTLQLCWQTLSCRQNDHGSPSGAEAPYSDLGRGRLAETKVDESRSRTPKKNPKSVISHVKSLADAGATWWLEEMWSLSKKDFRQRIEQGPPAIGGQ